MGDSLQDAIQTTETLLSENFPLENFSPVSEQEKNLSNSFSSKQPLITMNTLTETNKLGIPEKYASIAAQQLGNNLSSALSLGNIETLTPEIEWVKGLLREHIQNETDLTNFLEAYAKSIDSMMGEEGQPIASWLRAQANN